MLEISFNQCPAHFFKTGWKKSAPRCR